MSNELTMFLRQRGIACSRTSVYTAPGNGQCERYNGIIWTAIIKSRKLGIAQQECVLPDALHFHTFSAVYGDEWDAARTSGPSILHDDRHLVSIPTWLSAPGPVFLKRRLRSSRYDPIVDEAELVHATPNYVQIRFPSGRESTAPLRDIAPVGEFEPDSPSDRAERSKRRGGQRSSPSSA